MGNVTRGAVQEEPVVGGPSTVLYAPSLLVRGVARAPTPVANFGRWGRRGGCWWTRRAFFWCCGWFTVLLALVA